MLYYLLPDTTFGQMYPVTEVFLVECDLGIPLGHHLWQYCLTKERVKIFTVLWSTKSRAASWRGRSHKPRVTPLLAVPHWLAAVPLCLWMVGRAEVIARSIGKPWQNKWCTRSRSFIRSKRRLGQRKVWGQDFSIHPKAPSRRHILRQTDLHHTSYSGWSPSPEPKWCSWPYGQSVSWGSHVRPFSTVTAWRNVSEERQKITMPSNYFYE